MTTTNYKTVGDIDKDSSFVLVQDENTIEELRDMLHIDKEKEFATFFESLDATQTEIDEIYGCYGSIPYLDCNIHKLYSKADFEKKLARAMKKRILRK